MRLIRAFWAGVLRHVAAILYRWAGARLAAGTHVALEPSVLGELQGDDLLLARRSPGPPPHWLERVRRGAPDLWAALLAEPQDQTYADVVAWDGKRPQASPSGRLKLRSPAQAIEVAARGVRPPDPPVAAGVRAPVPARVPYPRRARRLSVAPPRPAASGRRDVTHPTEALASCRNTGGREAGVALQVDASTVVSEETLKWRSVEPPGTAALQAARPRVANVSFLPTIFRRKRFQPAALRPVCEARVADSVESPEAVIALQKPSASGRSPIWQAIRRPRWSMRGASWSQVTLLGRKRADEETPAQQGVRSQPMRLPGDLSLKPRSSEEDAFSGRGCALEEGATLRRARVFPHGGDSSGPSGASGRTVSIWALAAEPEYVWPALPEEPAQDAVFDWPLLAQWWEQRQRLDREQRGV